MRLCLDTNILVDAVRSRALRERLADLLATEAEIVLSSVVVSEVEGGIRTPRDRRTVEEGLVGTLFREAVISAPSEEDWLGTGRLLAERRDWSRTASRQNDVLLAMQCARLGWELVTRDVDFLALEALVPGLRVLAPRAT